MVVLDEMKSVHILDVFISKVEPIEFFDSMGTGWEEREG